MLYGGMKNYLKRISESEDSEVITTTLKKLKAAEACVERYTHLRKSLGNEFLMSTTLPLTKILETNGLEDTLWALEHVVDSGDKILRLWAADCAEHVLHVYTEKYPNDTRPADAIKAARQYANGEISDAARAAARAAASDASDVARAASDAAWVAARAASDVARATSDAASDAAWVARATSDVETTRWQTTSLIQYLNEEVK